MKYLYEVISYDVWGNASDGFEVNQAFHTGREFEIDSEATDYAINRKLGVQGVTWGGEPEYTLYGTLKRNGMPALELQRVTEERDQ